MSLIKNSSKKISENERTDEIHLSRIGKKMAINLNLVDAM